MNTGISYIDFYIPKIYLDIEEYSKIREINADKLKKGLGIYKMSFLDVHEDTATLGANALHNLIDNNNIDPHTINRIYLGTESALDGSKPTATYITNMVEQKIGKRVFKHTDVVDMTFACIGAVDAFQNAIDYIKVHPDQRTVVIASDFAKYELNSPGEYTQGAGAVALLIESEAKLMQIPSTFGIGYKSEHDFFKPRRCFQKKEATNEYTTDNILQVHRDEPVFDGQFSNKCYQDRMREAYFDFKSKIDLEKPLHETWNSLIFHLPYAAHGKRIFSEIYQLEKNKKLPNENLEEQYDSETLKSLTKTEEYKQFVKDKIYNAQLASGQIGNMYAASIFMSLISEIFYKKDQLSTGDTLGFIAYGSGSKAKVFEGKLAKDFKEIADKLNLHNRLENRSAIDFSIYEDLHRKKRNKSVIQPKKEFILDNIYDNDEKLTGKRSYIYVE